MGRRAAEDMKAGRPKRVFNPELDYPHKNSWTREYAKAKFGFDFRGLEAWKETLTKVQIARGMKPTAKLTAMAGTNLSSTPDMATSSTSKAKIMSKKAGKRRAETPPDEWVDALDDDDYQPPAYDKPTTTRSGRVTKRPR
jgi:hypothetical protein